MFDLSSRILVVDDSESIVDQVIAELTGIGFYNIFRAVDGKEALDKLVRADRMDTQVHLVICDWNMPKLSGLELLKKVRMFPRWHDIPFIMLTSQNQIIHVAQAISAGVSGYVVKPLEPGVLTQKLIVISKNQKQS